MFQGLNNTTLPAATKPDRGSFDVRDFAALVHKYPDVSEVELARLINHYRELSALDVALMISDEQMGSKLERFFADQRSHLRTPFRQYAALVVTALVGLSIVIWTLVPAP